MKKINFIFALLLILTFITTKAAFAWKEHAKWYSPCSPDKLRVWVICNDGRGPKFVQEAPDKWCMIGQPGRCTKSLDASAKDWCKE